MPTYFVKQAQQGHICSAVVTVKCSKQTQCISIDTGIFF